MKKFLICALIVGIAAAKPVYAAPTAAAKARAIALLDRSIAFYKMPKSFTVKAREEVRVGSKVSSSRMQTALQFPTRALLQVDRVDATGKLLHPQTRRMIDAKSYQQWNLVGADYDVNHSDYRALKTGSRLDVLKQLYETTPNLAFATFVMASGENPAREKQTIARTSRATEAGVNYDVVTLVTRQKSEDFPLTIRYFLKPKTREIAKLVATRDAKENQLQVTTRFSPLAANWKGSQSATDAAVYNWKTIEIEGMAAPAPKAKPVVSVEPKARQLWQRAADFYGALDGLRLEWTKKSVDPNGAPELGISSASVSQTTNKMAILSTGKLRLEMPDGLDAITVIDGTTKTTLEGILGGDEPEYSVVKLELDAEDAVFDELQFSGKPLPILLGELLQENNSLNAESIQTRVEIEELMGLRAAVLPSQSFQGQSCDIVRITTRFKDKYVTYPGLTTKQETYWFSQKDGRLMRFQTQSQVGNRKPQTSDIQIVRQEINPVFDAQTWKFLPPTKAATSK